MIRAVAATLLLVALGTTGCQDRSGAADGQAGPGASPLPSGPPLLEWTMVEIERRSEGCSGSEYGCARARLVYPDFAGDDALTRAARAWTAERMGESTLLEAATTEAPEALAEQFVAAFDAFQREYPNDLLPGWELDRAVEVAAPAGPVVVLMVSEMVYTGGAHPNSWVRYQALVPESGEFLSLDAMLASGGEAPLQELVEARFREDVGLAPGQALTEAGLFEDRIPLVDNVEPGPRGLTFHFNPYAIGPHAMGMIRVTLPWNRVRPHLAPSAADLLAPWFGTD
jgi:hypothetical protein